jgi:IMP dehydrogenase/GMP reductase
VFFNQAGNVVTGEMVEQLILNGADIVKVGIGPGNKKLICTANYSVLSRRRKLNLIDEF